MADDGIAGEVLDVIGDVAGAVGGELKKFGQAATSQGTGHLKTNVSGPQKGSSVPQAGVSDESPVGEFKKILQTAGSQITGHPVQETGDLSKMAQKDKDWSNKEAAAVAARINQIYQEYAAKRAQEEKQKAAMEQQKEEQKKAQEVQFEEKKKQQSMDIAVAQGKASAEIKNYGAE